jgi:hypothetical protein
MFDGGRGTTPELPEHGRRVVVALAGPAVRVRARREWDSEADDVGGHGAGSGGEGGRDTPRMRAGRIPAGGLTEMPCSRRCRSGA